MEYRTHGQKNRYSCLCLFRSFSIFFMDVAFYFFNLAFDFCRFSVVIRFFSSPPQRSMTSDFEGFLYQILSIASFFELNSWGMIRNEVVQFEAWTNKIYLRSKTSLTTWYNDRYTRRRSQMFVQVSTTFFSMS